MAKLIFYGWELGMNPICFIKLLKEKTHLSLREAAEVRIIIGEGKPYQIIIEDENIANEVCEKAREYKVLVRKE